MLSAFLLLAQAQPDAGATQSPGGGLASMFVPLVLIFVVFYFLILRPAKRQEQERVAMLGTLKKNDKVITSGGLIGIVYSIKDKEEEVVLKVDDSSNVRLRVPR